MLAAALLVGCGTGSGAETPATANHPAPAHKAPPHLRDLTVALAGWDAPPTAGMLMAEHRGYFADGGLEVLSLSPATPALSILDVVDRSDEIGVAYGPQVLVAKHNDVPITVVGSLIPRSTAAMMWLKDSGVRGISDLKGKTIAIPGLRFQEGFLRVLLLRAGLTLDDVTVKHVRNNLVSALVSGRADAIFGGSWNVEAAMVESHGLDPIIRPVTSFGFPKYEELVLVARTDFASKQPQLVRQFISALARGTDAAVNNSGSVIDLIELSAESNPESNRTATRVGLERTLPMLSPSGQPSLEWEGRLASWMSENGLFEAP